MQRWTPRVDLLPQEKMLMKRLTRVRALLDFCGCTDTSCWMPRSRRSSRNVPADGRGRGANPRRCFAWSCSQGYVGASDAEAVELSLVDLRWQMVLDCLGATSPPFSQGDFRLSVSA